MLLKIKGHDRNYDIQSMCMTFFPYDKVIITDDLRKKAQVKVLSAVEIKNDKYICKTIIKNKDKKAQKTVASKDLETLSLRDALKISFYHAAIKCTDIVPPWGVLTGIRPANFALELLEKGESFEKAEKSLQKNFFIMPNKARLCVKVANKGQIIKKTSDEKSASLFISIPFCPSRCRYCSFVTHAVENALKLLPEYVDMLCEEIALNGKQIKEEGLKIKSIYIGGGTPTVLNAEMLDKIFCSVENNIDLSHCLEFTLEAGRPDTFTAEKLDVIKKHNIDRLCINTQSLNDEVLKAIGRPHTANDFFEAYKLAVEKGFDNINVDLIAGLEKDNPESFESSVSQICALEPANITIHTLCVKKASYMATDTSGLIARWNDTSLMLDKAEKLLEKAGYEPYYMYRQKNTLANLENTGYSKKGKECLYNIYMMDDVHTVIGVGAGAVTKIIDQSTNQITRIFNPKYPYEYLARGNLN
ncbi:MAG: coproporphyrinogen dehydrogenase HemZ [Ruminococcaceae bacterium]|nr:coproporphyrinogen dehydrogenase HemZ [Oscillospiraceae bacterium]